MEGGQALDAQQDDVGGTGLRLLGLGQCFVDLLPVFFSGLHVVEDQEAGELDARGRRRIGLPNRAGTQSGSMARTRL